MDWLIEEMEARLRKIGSANKRNIHEYNEIASRKLPFIMLVIDELADILEGKAANDKLGKIVQKSRAAGVHVIAATQRPSVNIVSGSIKANFQARLSFRLPSEADSRTVLGLTGAEHLLSRGDMLFASPNAQATRRLHSAFASLDDLRAAVAMTSARRPVQNRAL
jgi:S-DNA-T family DNA segregation ATPase FtsK/SpoIIIE